LKNVVKLEVFEFEKFFEAIAVPINDESDDNSVIDDFSYTLFIAENKRHECPRVLIKPLEQDIFAFVNTGCEFSIMNEHLYNRLRHEGLKCFEPPT
jgi:hypothetical protein